MTWVGLSMQRRQLPFKVGLLVALEHKDTQMAFALWS